jgi:hypothetical protein
MNKTNCIVKDISTDDFTNLVVRIDDFNAESIYSLIADKLNKNNYEHTLLIESMPKPNFYIMFIHFDDEQYYQLNCGVVIEQLGDDTFRINF